MVKRKAQSVEIDSGEGFILGSEEISEKTVDWITTVIHRITRVIHL